MAVHRCGERGRSACRADNSQRIANLSDRRPSAAKLLRNQRLEESGCLQLGETFLDEAVVTVVIARAALDLRGDFARDRGPVLGCSAPAHCAPIAYSRFRRKHEMAKARA